jgi:Carboxypeptidase regulatory-like domain
VRVHVESDIRCPRHDSHVALLLLALTLALPACDTFFDIRGRVTDCGTSAPIAGVSIDVHIDRGFHDEMASLPNEAMTDAGGNYRVGLNSPSDTWATLTFHRDGYSSFTSPQFKGHDINDPPYDVCLTPIPAP